MKKCNIIILKMLIKYPIKIKGNESIMWIFINLLVYEYRSYNRSYNRSFKYSTYKHKIANSVYIYSVVKNNF